MYLIIRDQSFLDDFHGIDASCLFELDHEHLCVAASSNHPNQLKIANRILSGSWFQVLI